MSEPRFKPDDQAREIQAGLEAVSAEKFAAEAESARSRLSDFHRAAAGQEVSEWSASEQREASRRLAAETAAWLNSHGDSKYLVEPIEKSDGLWVVRRLYDGEPSDSHE